VGNATLVVANVLTCNSPIIIIRQTVLPEVLNTILGTVVGKDTVKLQTN